MEPDRFTAAVSAMAGGAFYGLVHVSALVLTGQPITTQDMVRAGVNVVCAILGGALVAYYLLPNLAAAIPWKSLQDAHGLGFVIGAFAWVLAPSAYRFAKAWGERKAQENAP